MNVADIVECIELEYVTRKGKRKAWRLKLDCGHEVITDKIADGPFFDCVECPNSYEPDAKTLNKQVTEARALDDANRKQRNVLH